MEKLKIICSIFCVILFLNTGCKKENTLIGNNNVVEDYSQYRAHFKGFINGQYYNFGVLYNDAGTTNAGGILTPFISDTSRVSFSSLIAKSNHFPTSNNDLEITIYKNYKKSLINSYPIPDSIFRSYFTIGEKRLVIDNSPVSSDSTFEQGVLITWTDTNGVKWASAKNTFNITGNNFNNSNNRNHLNIKNSIYQPADTIMHQNIHRIETEFNCVLYNINGDSITIYNGAFVGLFLNIY